MRKMAKGAAVTGAVFCIISILFSLIGLLVNIANYSRMGHTEMIGNLLATNIPGLLVFVFLAIVLFRRKADTFAGVIFILLGVYALFNAVQNVLAISTYQMVDLPLTPLFFAIAGNLFRGILHILMAVHCFRKNAGKTPLFGIGFIVVGLVATVQSVIQFASNGIFSFNPGAAVVAMIPVILGAVIGALPLILAGFAVGNAKADAPLNPDDPYGLYAKYGIQPPTAQAQYQAPQQQSWQQPQYQPNQQQSWQQPQYQAPQQQSWQQPQYQAPQQQSWQQPQYQPNQQQTWQQPQYQAPQQQSWQQPQYRAPQQENEQN